MLVLLPVFADVNFDIGVELFVLILEFFRLKANLATNLHLAQGYTEKLAMFVNGITCRDF